MRLLDTYALATASKIDKPFIYDSFFPLPFAQYITFQAQTKFESRNYAYWQDVINILFPVLQAKNIHIVQVGIAADQAYSYVYDARGKTGFSHLAYLIKNAQLHLGPDSLGTHLASAYDVPIVSIYSVCQASVSGPHFGSPDKQIVFESFLRTRNGKPSYAAQETPKSINLIKPEELANSVFKLLGLDSKCPYETVYLGEKYCSRIAREFCPISPAQLEHPEIPIEIRMDLHFDEAVLAQQLSVCKGIIVTNKPIRKELLVNLKANIAALVYFVEEDDNPEFIESISDTGIPLIFVTTLPPDKLQEKKLNYYQHGNINVILSEPEEKIIALKKDLNKLYFRANKLLFSDGRFFATNAARVSSQPVINDFTYYKFMDQPEFWCELPWMSIVKKLD